MIDKEAADALVEQATAVKAAVKDVLRDLSKSGHLKSTHLTGVISQALGDVVELKDKDGFTWREGVFPNIQNLGRHTVDYWRYAHADILNCQDTDLLNALAIYHTALATSSTKHHTLVSKRRVDEAWVVEYNPYCLEAKESNMVIRLIMHTPKTVLDYITKGNSSKLCNDD